MEISPMPMALIRPDVRYAHCEGRRGAVAPSYCTDP